LQTVLESKGYAILTHRTILAYRARSHHRFGGQKQLAAEGKRRKMEDILKLFAKNTGARYSRIPD